MTSMKKVVALGGDGIGPEVLDAACQVLEEARFGLELIRPLCGEAALDRGEDAFPGEARQACSTADAVLFGATGTTSGAILRYLRWELDNFVNVRPLKYYQGAKNCIRDPEGIDFVILRENSEGMYSFFGGDLSMLRERLPDLRSRTGRSLADYGEGKFALRIVSERGTRRLARFTCDFALERKARGFPGRIACPTKSNVIPATDPLFARIVEEETLSHPELSFQHFYADDMARRLLRFPREMDVIVAENMFGDILADEAAEIVGGLGMAPSACLGGRVPYFEPVHGSAPDIAGRGIANPTAMLLSAALMLRHLGMAAEADAVERAVARVYREGTSLTPDQDGSSTTAGMAGAVARAIT